MLSVNNVTKRYGKVLAVDDLSFEGPSGEITVLLGPNGAGKSTIIKCIAGLLQYNGKILVDGYANKTIDAKRILSYVPESPALFDSLTVSEHIQFVAKAYRLKDFEDYAEELFARFDLSDKKDKLGNELSKGMQQKVSICCAVITSPKVILLDEPMMGLDPKAIKELKNLFLELREQGCAVLISTHIIDTIKEIWDNILIMHKAKLVSRICRSEVEDEVDIEKRFFAVTGTGGQE
jgi:ABC-2 type transport system ATP-binding protein